ncbi:oxidoreductase, partial [Escherichia coli]
MLATPGTVPPRKDTRVSLFSPTTVGAVDVRNRVSLAPMTRLRASADGVPGHLIATYYAQRASIGLLVT